MEATLCLRVCQTPLRKPCSPLTLHGTNATLVGRSSCHFGLLRRTPARPPITIDNIRRGLDHNVHQVFCSQASSLESGNHRKAAGGRNNHGAVAVGAAAVALACVLGVVCTKQAMRAGAASRLGWISRPGSPPVQVQQPDRVSPRQAGQDKSTMQHSTVDMLSEMVHLLDTAKSKLKEHPPAMKMSEDKDSTALCTEWREKFGPQKKVGPLEKYEFGLSLSEILINRGEYKKAECVCKDIEPLRPSSDGRFALRMFIINVSTQLENVINEAKKSWQDYLNYLNSNGLPPSAPVA